MDRNRSRDIGLASALKHVLKSQYRDPKFIRSGAKNSQKLNHFCDHQ